MENPGEEECLHVEVDGPSKPVRHRKKMFYRTLRHQMEFYFSDANINKNRFMGKRLLEDPQIELTLFLTFNKIREMTDNVNDIAKALRKSKMLSITEDGLKVFRTTEICQRKKEDECTIYVEQLPPDAEHEWLRSVFLPYGGVPYVSIPKYNLSKMNKGFAFVEFDSPETASQALEAFEKMGCRLSSQISPEEISSNMVKEERDDDADTDPDKDLFKKPNAKIDMFKDYARVKRYSVIKEIDSETNRKGTKRRLDDEVSEPDNVSEKKLKVDIDEGVVEDCDGEELKGDEEKGEEANTTEGEEMQEQDINEKQNDAVEAEVEEEVEGEDDEEEGKRRKSRKHKKKKIRHFEKRIDPKLALRVMSKVEWKILRNRYVSLQKSKMKALKHQLARSRWVDNYSQPPRPQLHKDAAEKQLAVEKPPKVFTFVPGVIVRVAFKEPAIDVKAFKAVARMHKDVVYVDVSEGATEAFVRCGSTETAGRLIKDKVWSNMSLMDGDAEKDYWEKITRDRDQKVKGNVANLVKRRGREKLLKKAEKALGKHIRFEDPE